MKDHGFDKKNAGLVVRKHRNLKGITQSSLAELLGVDDSTITKLERGNGGSLYLVAAISDVLGFSMEELMPHRVNKRSLDLFSTTNALTDIEFEIFLGAGRGGVEAYRKIGKRK